MQNCYISEASQSAVSSVSSLRGGTTSISSGGGGGTPYSSKVFGRNGFPEGGRGVPPNSVKENSTKKQVF